MGQEEEATPTDATPTDAEIVDIERQIVEAVTVEDYDTAGTSRAYVCTSLNTSLERPSQEL